MRHMNYFGARTPDPNPVQLRTIMVNTIVFVEEPKVPTIIVGQKNSIYSNYYQKLLIRLVFFRQFKSCLTINLGVDHIQINRPEGGI